MDTCYTLSSVYEQSLNAKKSYRNTHKLHINYNCFHRQFINPYTMSYTISSAINRFRWSECSMLRLSSRSNPHSNTLLKTTQGQLSRMNLTLLVAIL